MALDEHDRRWDFLSIKKKKEKKRTNRDEYTTIQFLYILATSPGSSVVIRNHRVALTILFTQVFRVIRQSLSVKLRSGARPTRRNLCNGYYKTPTVPGTWDFSEFSKTPKNSAKHGNAPLDRTWIPQKSVDCGNDVALSSPIYLLQKIYLLPQIRVRSNFSTCPCDNYRSKRASYPRYVHTYTRGLGSKRVQLRTCIKNICLKSKGDCDRTIWCVCNKRILFS